VREAETGALGLNEAAVQRPDAIVLDLICTDMTDSDVLRRIASGAIFPC